MGSYDRRNAAPFRLESDRRLSQITPHAVIGECFGHSRAHVRIQARHRLVECLDKRCFDIPISKRLRYFETDVASAHDDCALRFLRVKEISQLYSRLKIVQGKHTLRIDSRNVGALRLGPRCDQKQIEWFIEFIALGEIDAANSAGVEIDLGYFMTGSGVDIEIVSEDLWRPDDQSLRVIDDTSGKVGQPARRVRGVRALLESDDLQFVSRHPSPSLRGCAHARRVTADDDEPAPTGHSRNPRSS